MPITASCFHRKSYSRPSLCLRKIKGNLDPPPSLSHKHSGGGWEGVEGSLAYRGFAARERRQSRAASWAEEMEFLSLVIPHLLVIKRSETTTPVLCCFEKQLDWITGQIPKDGVVQMQLTCRWARQSAEGTARGTCRGRTCIRREAGATVAIREMPPKASEEAGLSVLVSVCVWCL